MRKPDAPGAIARYREHAAGYDASARRTMPLRYLYVRWNNAPYMTTQANLRTPWKLL